MFKIGQLVTFTDEVIKLYAVSNFGMSGTVLEVLSVSGTYHVKVYCHLSNFQDWIGKTLYFKYANLKSAE